MAITRLMVLGIPGPALGPLVFRDPDPFWSEIQEPTVELWTEVEEDGTLETWSALSTVATVETWTSLSTLSTPTWIKLLRFG